MKILIKFPTRGRIFKFFTVLDQYYSMSNDLDNIKFLITIDSDDIIMNNPEVIKMFEKYKNLTYIFGDSKTKVEAVNRDMGVINDWDILLLASDDMIPKVKGYDDIIRNNMKKYFSDTDGVLWFNDGYQQRKLNTLCILGRKYYERFNYIYNPEYKSVWCDNEFMNVADILKKQIYFDNVIIKHEHPDWGFGGRDIVHTLNSQNELSDKYLYLERLKNNFYLK
jgi:hypothetical protein